MTLMFIFVIAILACLAAIGALYAGLNYASLAVGNLMEKLYVITLLLGSYVSLVFVCGSVLVEILEVFRFDGMWSSCAWLLSAFVLAPRLLSFFMRRGSELDKNVGKLAGKVYREIIEERKVVEKHTVDFVNLVRERLAVHRQEMSDELKDFMRKQITYDDVYSLLNAREENVEKVFDRKLSDINNRVTEEFSSVKQEIRELTEQVKRIGLQAKSLEERRKKELKYEGLPERVRAIIPKALETIQREGVSEELIEALPDEVTSLRYQPINHRILLTIQKILSKGGRPTISAISTLTGVNKKELKTFLQQMIYKDLVETKVKGRTVLYLPSQTHFIKNLFEPILKSQRDGGEIAFQILTKAREHYMNKGWLFITLRQTPGAETPDAVAIPPPKERARRGWSLIDAKALEFETPNEIRAHPDQTLFNMVKNFAMGFKGVEVWCLGESIEKLEKLRFGLTRQIKDRVVIKAVEVDSQKRAPQQQ